jgi:hypothetical protein
MKTKSLIFTIAALLILCAANSYAANIYGPFWINKCNELPDANYASVYINDDYPIAASPDPYHYLVTVYPNESILVPGSNYGIQAFGLNYAHDPNNLKVFVLKSMTDDSVDTKWSIDRNAPSSFGPFGVFVFDGDTTGKNRKNPLRIYIGSDIPLTYTDFYVANEDLYMFACHIAGFKDMGGGIIEITSAKFALPIPTLIELTSFTAKAGNKKVTLNWVTQAELDNAGFNIYRSTEKAGPYVPVNADLILAKGSIMGGAKYQFIDRSVQNREEYFYILEDIDTYGITTKHGPVSATPRFMNLFDK